jgi:hypothetical protein
MAARLTSPARCARASISLRDISRASVAVRPRATFFKHFQDLIPEGLFKVFRIEVGRQLETGIIMEASIRGDGVKMRGQWPVEAIAAAYRSGRSLGVRVDDSAGNGLIRPPLSNRKMQRPAPPANGFFFWLGYGKKGAERYARILTIAPYEVAPC